MKKKANSSTISMKALKEFSRRVDIDIAFCKFKPPYDPATMGGLYSVLNKHYLSVHDGGEWIVLRGPTIIGDYIVVPVARPRDDNREEE